MFVHAVLFEIKPGEIKRYRSDCRLWAGYARKASGFVGCYTMKRVGHKNQYASVYEWKNKMSHDRFMKRHHDPLVGKSSARVKVLGYYNMSAEYKLKK